MSDEHKGLHAEEGLEPVPTDRPACSAEAARMITARSDEHDGCHSKRERIALGVFACLLLAGAIVLFSYITAGHGLNVAATTIDDATGDMSGYGVILFEGTVRPDSDAEEEGGVQGVLSGIFGSGEEDVEAPEPLAGKSAGSSGVASAGEASAGGSSSEASVLDAADGSDGMSDTEDAGEAANAREGTREPLPEDDSTKAAPEAGKASDADGLSASGASASEGSSQASSTANSASRSASSRAKTPNATPITLDDAQEEYREKGASVISIDSGDLGSYVAGRIVMQGGRSYGIFSLTEDDLAGVSHRSATTTRVTTTTTEDAMGLRTTNTTTRTRSAYSSVAEMFEDVDELDVSPATLERIQGILKHFEDCGVDTVIALTADPTPFKFVEGVDVVVSFKQSDRFSMTETIGGTMYFDAPEVGQVGVLMVAPGNVVSAKVMS